MNAGFLREKTSLVHQCMWKHLLVSIPAHLPLHLIITPRHVRYISWGGTQRQASCSGLINRGWIIWYWLFQGQIHHWEGGSIVAIKEQAKSANIVTIWVILSYHCTVCLRGDFGKESPQKIWQALFMLRCFSSSSVDDVFGLGKLVCWVWQFLPNIVSFCLVLLIFIDSLCSFQLFSLQAMGWGG